MTDATNMVLVIGLGLCVPVLFGVRLWLAWPLLHRATEVAKAHLAKRLLQLLSG
jgi:hypothetical protein